MKIPIENLQIERVLRRYGVLHTAEHAYLRLNQGATSDNSCGGLPLAPAVHMRNPALQRNPKI